MAHNGPKISLKKATALVAAMTGLAGMVHKINVRIAVASNAPLVAPADRAVQAAAQAVLARRTIVRRVSIVRLVLVAIAAVDRIVARVAVDRIVARVAVVVARVAPAVQVVLAVRVVIVDVVRVAPVLTRRSRLT